MSSLDKKILDATLQGVSMGMGVIGTGLEMTGIGAPLGAALNVASGGLAFASTSFELSQGMISKQQAAVAYALDSIAMIGIVGTLAKGASMSAKAAKFGEESAQASRSAEETENAQQAAKEAYENRNAERTNQYYRQADKERPDVSDQTPKKKVTFDTTVSVKSKGSSSEADPRGLTEDKRPGEYENIGRRTNYKISTREKGPSTQDYMNADPARKAEIERERFSETTEKRLTKDPYSRSDDPNSERSKFEFEEQDEQYRVDKRSFLKQSKEYAERAEFQRKWRRRMFIVEGAAKTGIGLINIFINSNYKQNW